MVSRDKRVKLAMHNECGHDAVRRWVVQSLFRDILVSLVENP
jgi:hypothetical protein